LSAIVPTSLIATRPEVIITTLFAPDGFAASQKINDFSIATSAADHLVLIEQGTDSAKFLLYGSRLSSAAVIAPAGVALQPVGTRADDLDRLRLVQLTSDQLDADKQLVIRKASNEPPILIGIPAIASKPAPKPAAAERITVGADQVLIKGPSLAHLQAIRYKGKKLRFDLSTDTSSVTVYGLRAAGVTRTAATRKLELVFTGGKKAPVNLEIVSGKVETVPK
jgi:hypothetical protein